MCAYALRLNNKFFVANIPFYTDESPVVVRADQ